MKVVDQLVYLLLDSIYIYIFHGITTALVSLLNDCKSIITLLTLFRGNIDQLETHP